MLLWLKNLHVGEKIYFIYTLLSKMHHIFALWSMKYLN